MSDKITVRIAGTPSRAMSPNGSTGHHWAKVLAEKQKLIWLTKDALSTYDPLWEIEPPITVSITVAWEKYRKTMDGDNLLASLKSVIDLIARHAEIDDKHFVFAPIEQIRDKSGHGYTLITLEGDKCVS